MKSEERDARTTSTAIGTRAPDRGQRARIHAIDIV
jgi:hypothetical protein